MGNTESISSHDLVNAIHKSYDFVKLKNRALKMGINITVQSDGSIQLQNTQDLVKGNHVIEAPSGVDDIPNLVKKIEEKLTSMSTECGYIHFGYQ